MRDRFRFVAALSIASLVYLYTFSGLAAVVALYAVYRLAMCSADTDSTSRRRPLSYRRKAAPLIGSGKQHIPYNSVTVAANHDDITQLRNGKTGLLRRFAKFYVVNSCAYDFVAYRIRDHPSRHDFTRNMQQRFSLHQRESVPDY